jgi:hypothetical protein
MYSDITEFAKKNVLDLITESTLGYSEAFADEDKDRWGTTRSHDSNRAVNQISVRCVAYDGI